MWTTVSGQKDDKCQRIKLNAGKHAEQYSQKIVYLVGQTKYKQLHHKIILKALTVLLLA